MDFTKVTLPEKTNVLIAFMDIQGLRAIADVLSDPVDLFNLLNSWAKMIIKSIDTTTGRILKFIGDECLVIFPEADVDTGIRTLLSIKDQVEKYFKEKGFTNTMRITAHYGEVAIGQLGTGSSQRIDIIGESVNVAATLGRGEHRGQLIISPQAFRKLSTTTRRLFHKYTPPIVYVAQSK